MSTRKGGVKLLVLPPRIERSSARYKGAASPEMLWENNGDKSPFMLVGSISDVVLPLRIELRLPPYQRGVSTTEL